MHEPISSFLTLEKKRKPREEENKNKKYITLKVVKEEEEERNSSMDKEDISLLTSKFSKLLTSSKRSNKKYKKYRTKEPVDKCKAKIICYNCEMLNMIILN